MNAILHEMYLFVTSLLIYGVLGGSFCSAHDVGNASIGVVFNLGGCNFEFDLLFELLQPPYDNGAGRSGCCLYISGIFTSGP